MSPIILDAPTATVGADTLRIVTLNGGGRPVTVADLNDGNGYIRLRDTFKFTPAAANQQLSRSGRRYGGAKVVGETHDNASIGWTAYVKGMSPDDAAAKVETLLAEIEETARGRLIEWVPGQVTEASYFEIAGPGTWDPTYGAPQWVQNQALQVALTFPVMPLVTWAKPAWRDDFSVDTLADYTFDAGVAADVAVSGGMLVGSGTLTTERRARHTARGYAFIAGQGTAKGTPGATLTNFKVGRTLRASATSYVAVYVDDNGTNSRLRIDVANGGAPVNRSSTNLAARIVNGTPFWVRARIADNTVVAEYFTSQPTPMSTATLTATYALTVGEQAIPAGHAGFVFTPQHASASIDDLDYQPWARKNVTLPEKIAFDDPVPGDAPATADIAVTLAAAGSPVPFALIGWATRPGTPIAGVAPFGIIEAETGGDLVGWASTVVGGTRSGSELRDATVSGAETYTASWTVDPHTLAPDDFTDGEIDLEVWARVLLNTGLVSPKFTLSARPADGLTFGSERFTHEYGSAGKLVTPPSASNTYRFTRLGTLTLPVAPAAPSAWLLWLAASTAAGSTGIFGVDYLLMLPRRNRALSPTGVPAPTGVSGDPYPSFMAGLSFEHTRTIRSDLSGLAAKAPNNPYPQHGLGGSLIRLPPGPVDLLVKLSSMVPDDTTVSSVSETLAHVAAVSMDVTPRSFMLRS